MFRPQGKTVCNRPIMKDFRGVADFHNLKFGNYYSVFHTASNFPMLSHSEYLRIITLKKMSVASA